MSYKSSYTGAQIDAGIAAANTAVQPTRTVNGHALSADVTVTATDVGLGNVTNESKATMFGTPTFTGDSTLSSGNLVIGTSGKGIDFSATGDAAGMTSELLADYEEGTWTPTDTSGAGLSLASASGIYKKVGTLVTCYFSVTYPATANASGATIGGLPFTTSTGVPNPGGAFTLYSDSAVSPLNGAIATSATLFSIYTTAGAAVTNANLSGKTVRMCVSYSSAS